MLDWMKKLFKKEEEADNAPDVLELNRYSYKDEQEGRQIDVSPRQQSAGKFRFPLDVYEMQKKTQPRTIESEGRPQEKGQNGYIRQEKAASPMYTSPVRPTRRELDLPKANPVQPKVHQTSASPPRKTEVSKRPFRPTEVVSPVFGYRRPTYDLQRKQPPVDLVLSADNCSVVDAWLDKNGLLAPKTTVTGDNQQEHVLHEPVVPTENGRDGLLEAEERQKPIEQPAAAEEFRQETNPEEVIPYENAEAKSDVSDAEGPARLDEEAGLDMNEEAVILQAQTNEEIMEESPAEEAREEQMAEEIMEESPAEEAREEQPVEEIEEEPAVEVQEEKPAEKIEEEPERGTLRTEAHDTAGKQEASSAAPREKKRFIPYNVVMLKQDKQRLAEKQTSAPAAHEGMRVKEDETAVYTLPPITLLNIPPSSSDRDEEWLSGQKELLDTTFRNFNVGARVVHLTQGPAVTRFEVQPEPGVKVNKITNLSDDIKLNLAARDIRIEAPIPGKNAVGIEVPNRKSKPVFLREILRSSAFVQSESPLTVALGLDISGTPIVTDIRKMPHGLIAGSTGSGKSVCINAILTSILYKAQPHEVKLMLIDPKMVELAPYNAVPHLVSPVITDAKAATAALKWAVEEMERRYEMFAHAGARDLTRYNDMARSGAVPGEPMPYLVIVIDELADLMMVSPADVEEAICRIAQKARACGIHLLVATQRPSVDVITGLIKANIPTRIAFTVSSQVDSRTIIDISGAEKLLGRGDMLFLENGTSKPLRVQGVYVSDEEIEQTVGHVKGQMKPNYVFRQDELLKQADRSETEDELFYEACQFVLAQRGASTSLLQRQFRIGYNRAARLIEEMEAQGIISQARGTKPRDVLVTEEELLAMQDMNA